MLLIIRIIAGIKTIVIQAPSVNFATKTIATVIAVAIAPSPFRNILLWAPGPPGQPGGGSGDTQHQSAHNPAWRAVQIDREKRSNVTRHPPWPLLSCCIVKEKCGDRYKGQSSFLLQVRLQHVNHIDCACGVVVARWRGLGILSSARLALETAAHRAHT